MILTVKEMEVGQYSVSVWHVYLQNDGNAWKGDYTMQCNQFVILEVASLKYAVAFVCSTPIG